MFSAQDKIITKNVTNHGVVAKRTNHILYERVEVNDNYRIKAKKLPDTQSKPVPITYNPIENKYSQYITNYNQRKNIYDSGISKYGQFDQYKTKIQNTSEQYNYGQNKKQNIQEQNYQQKQNSQKSINKMQNNNICKIKI